MTNQQSQPKYEIGMVGLGVMVRNLLLNMSDHGFSVAGYDKEIAKVEALRQGTIRRRDAEAAGLGEEAAHQAATALGLVHSLPVEQSILLTRAFAFYFELINLAETNHRKRRRSALHLSGEADRQRGSLMGTLSKMRRVGISAQEALETLRRVLIVPVFTAHPTEVARRSMLFKRRRIVFIEDHFHGHPAVGSGASRTSHRARPRHRHARRLRPLRLRPPTHPPRLPQSLAGPRRQRHPVLQRLSKNPLGLG